MMLVSSLSALTSLVAK